MKNQQPTCIRHCEEQSDAAIPLLGKHRVSLNDRRTTLPRRTAITGTTLLLLNACATHASDPPSDQVLIAPGLTLHMPTAARLSRTIEVAQLVVARYGPQTLAFEARISAAPDHFDLLCIDTMGREALRIHWTQASVVAEKAPWVPENLRPENMLADIVILYWPEAVVAQSLAASGATIVAEPGLRSVRLDGKEVIHVDFQSRPGADPWNSKARYHNLSRDYVLDIQSRLLQP